MERTYNVLLTYDIDSRHTEVRNTLIEEYGFKDIIIGNNGTRCYLPNTTLLKPYLQPIITQYFIDNKSEIWLLFLIAHSKR